MRFVAGKGVNGKQLTGRRCAGCQQGPNGEQQLGTNEVLLAGAPWLRAIGKQLRARVAPAGRGTN